MIYSDYMEKRKIIRPCPSCKGINKVNCETCQKCGAKLTWYYIMSNDKEKKDNTFCLATPETYKRLKKDANQLVEIVNVNGFFELKIVENVENNDFFNNSENNSNIEETPIEASEKKNDVNVEESEDVPNIPSINSDNDEEIPKENVHEENEPVENVSEEESEDTELLQAEETNNSPTNEVNAENENLKLIEELKEQLLKKDKEVSDYADGFQKALERIAELEKSIKEIKTEAIVENNPVSPVENNILTPQTETNYKVEVEVKTKENEDENTLSKEDEDEIRRQVQEKVRREYELKQQKKQDELERLAYENRMIQKKMATTKIEEEERQNAEKTLEKESKSSIKRTYSFNDDGYYNNVTATQDDTEKKGMKDTIKKVCIIAIIIIAVLYGVLYFL